MKINYKILLIGTGVVVLGLGLYWFYRRRSTPTSRGGSAGGSGAPKVIQGAITNGIESLNIEGANSYISASGLDGVVMIVIDGNPANVQNFKVQNNSNLYPTMPTPSETGFNSRCGAGGNDPACAAAAGVAQDKDTLQSLWGTCSANAGMKYGMPIVLVPAIGSSIKFAMGDPIAVVCPGTTSTFQMIGDGLVQQLN
jgi:hypothetical protein